MADDIVTKTKTYTDKVRTAMYGKEVRSSIADSIDKIAENVKEEIANDTLAINVNKNTNIAKIDNLINYDTLTDNKFIIQNTGALKDNDGYCTTDFIYCKNIKKVCNSESQFFYAFYNENKELIIAALSNSNILEVPANACYIRISLSKAIDIAEQWLTANKNNTYEEVLYKANNLINYDTLTDNVFIVQKTGELKNNDGYCTTDFICCRNIKKIFNSESQFFYAFYDKNRNLIIAALSTSNILEVPANACYIRISLTKAIDIKDQFITYYEKNDSVDVKYINDMCEANNLINYDTLTDNVFIIQGTGTLTANSNYSTTDFIYCKGINSFYNSEKQFFYAFYDKNKELIIAALSNSNILEVPANACYIRISMCKLVNIKDQFLMKYNIEKTVNVNTITVGVGQTYTDIKSALDSITDNSKFNQYVIDLTEGDYNISRTTQKYLGFKNYVSIIGRNKAKCRIINRKSSTEYNAEYSCIDAACYTEAIEYAKISNLTLISEGGKCPIHIDTDYTHFAKGGVIEIENCELLDMNDFTRMTVPGNMLGGINVGLRGGQTVKINNCRSNGTIYAHTNKATATEGATFDVRNSTFRHAWISDLLDNSRKDIFNYINCKGKHLLIGTYELGTNNGIYSITPDFSGSEFEYYGGFYQDSTGAEGSKYDFWDKYFNGKLVFPVQSMHELVKASEKITRGDLVKLTNYDIYNNDTVSKISENCEVYGIAMENIQLGQYGYIQVKNCFDYDTTNFNIGDYLKVVNGTLVASDTKTNLKVVATNLVKLFKD